MTELDDITYVEETTVSCEGNGDTIGHPLVYLDLTNTGEVVCPYCSRHFVLKHLT